LQQDQKSVGEGGLIVQHMPKPSVKDHPFRRWQEMLVEKLEEPFNDREVIFVIDKDGNCGKSWFTDMYMERYGKCYTVGADKRDDISYQLINKIIEEGPPNVVFMDAPRARARYVSSAWLEEIKNAKIVSAKYKSKTLHLPHRPHMVVMMNEFPARDLNEKGLSEDRYVYLVVDKNGSDAEWLKGYRCGEGGATASDPNNPLIPYNIIWSMPQSTLPDSLQIGVNRAFKIYCDNPNPQLLETGIAKAITHWSRKMEKTRNKCARLD
jgi:hypothetical protein